MNEKTFLELVSSDFVPYVGSISRKSDFGALNALRADATGYLSAFPGWPSDLDLLLQLEKLHRSVSKNCAMPEPMEQDSQMLMFPKVYIDWLATNSFQEISNQLVNHFASWAFQFERRAIFSQSPSVLHDRIRERIHLTREQCEEASRDESLGLKQFRSRLREIFDISVPWLDQFSTFESSNGICDEHFICVYRFYAKDSDIKQWFDSFSPYSEWDVDAFTFWKHVDPKDYWPSISSIRDDSQGWVYLITDGEFFKIGFSNNDPSSRLAACQTGNANELRLVASIPGDVQLEKSLHRRFENNRIRGEWFRLTPSDITSVWGEIDVDP